MRRRIAALATAVAAIGSLAAASPALAASPKTPASVKGTATIPIGSLTVDAHNTPSGGATGHFTASGSIVPATVPFLGPLTTFTLSGPVTCLNVSGHSAGLIYPIASAAGPIGKYTKGLAVYISIKDSGNSEQVGFLGPAPVNSLKSCPALISFLPVTKGHITVTPAH